LQLANTQISDVGLRNLKECVGLRQLDIRHTKISQNASVHLRHLPVLKVTYCKGTDLESIAGQTVNTTDEVGPYFKPVKNDVVRE